MKLSEALGANSALAVAKKPGLLPKTRRKTLNLWFKTQVSRPLLRLVRDLSNLFFSAREG